jgi:hypothetical protein
LVLFIILAAICIMFSIPLEFAVVILFPFAVVTAFYNYEFWYIVGVMIIYLSFVVAKHFPFR